MQNNVTVPVSDPRHPSHPTWLEILLGIFRAASNIGPVVVQIADPADAGLAINLGKVSNSVLDSIEQTTGAQQ